MSELVKLARLGLTRLIKATDDREIGRSPTVDSAPSASPSVPSEEAAVGKDDTQRDTVDIIQDAITVLEEGLRSQESDNPEHPEQLDQHEKNEVKSAVEFMKKTLAKDDVPVSVKAIVKDSFDRTLMLRDAESEYWDLPGGHMREGETLDKALRREVHEETGMELGKCDQVDTRMLKFRKNVRPVMFYKAEYVGGTPRCSKEHIGYEWADGDELGRLNLGVYKDILIPGADADEVLEQGSPSAFKDAGGSGGIAGVGNPVVGDDVHTPAIGSGKKRRTPKKKLKMLVRGKERSDYVKFLKAVVSGDGDLVSGEDVEKQENADEWEERPVSKNRVKLMKGLDSKRLGKTNIRIINKAKGEPFIIAGYASPVIVDLEGHRVSHEALANDLPRFMADDGEYANVNILHSNITVGKVLPEFTAKDGTTYKTVVDDIGLYAVAEIRTDKNAPDVIAKVIDEIESGRLRSFSISGDADNPVFTCDDEGCFFDISKVNLFELTVCLPPNEKVWTKQGLRSIDSIQVGDDVLTHKARWMPVTDVMSRDVNEDLIVLETEDGVVRLTKEHPVRVIKHLGRNKGTRYEWIPVSDVSVGDIVQAYKSLGDCKACGTPLFEKWNKDKVFCSIECKAKIPNRKGKTIESGDLGAISHASKVRGITKEINPNLTGGIKTEEGKRLHREAITSESFKETARRRAIRQWNDPEFVKAQLDSRGESPNKLEKEFSEFTGLPFVGNGELIIDGKRPDFLVGQNKVVELYGDYWHRGETGLDRIKFFADRGYECLIVWENESRNDPYAVKERIKEFAMNKFSKVLSVSLEKYEGKVYNLEVEEDNSYVTEAAVLHNCEEGVNQDAKFDIISRARS